MGARESKQKQTQTPATVQDSVKRTTTVNALQQQQQLTTELWQTILIYVEPEEFKVFIDNCPQYQNDLRKLAPSFLFPLVIGVLMKNGYLVEHPQPILTYRLISPKVKAVIDSFLIQYPPPWLTDAFTFPDSAKIDEFIENFPAEGLPICSPSLLQKTVEIVARTPVCFDNALILFLGSGRWMTEVDLQLEFQPCPERLMRHLYVALSLLPNLEALHLSAVVEPRRMPPYNPLPQSYASPLKNLKELSLCFTSSPKRNMFGEEQNDDGMFSLAPLLNSFLQTYGRKLQHFATCDSFFEHAGLAAPQISALFAELKELRIGFRDMGKAAGVFELLQEIKLPKLEELRLDNFYEGENERIHFSWETVKALQNFRNSLKSLWIGSLNGECICGIDPAEEKSFPWLKKLVICTSNREGPVWRIFYNQFRELEELRFQMGSEVQQDSTVPVEQLRGRFNIFPKLKRIVWSRGSERSDVVIRR